MPTPDEYPDGKLMAIGLYADVLMAAQRRRAFQADLTRVQAEAHLAELRAAGALERFRASTTELSDAALLARSSGWTVADLAHATGLSRQQVSQLIARRPSDCGDSLAGL